MRQTSLVLALSLTIAGASGGERLAAQAGATFSVTIDKLAPGSTLDLTLNGSRTGHATTSGTAGGDGALNLALDLGNMGKAPVQVQVFVGDQCVDHKTRIELVEQGTDPSTIPPECKRRLAGVFWWNKAKALHINASGATISVEHGGMSMTTKLLIGGGGAALAGGLIAGGGSDSGASSTSNSSSSSTTPSTPTTPTTPTPPSAPNYNGTYSVTITVNSDPNGHNPFVQYGAVTQVVVTVNGTQIGITGNSPWVSVTGTMSGASASLTGTGFVAGRSNVQVTMTLNFASSGIAASSAGRPGPDATATLNGTIVIGQGGGLPNGPITYNISGTKTS